MDPKTQIKTEKEEMKSATACSSDQIQENTPPQRPTTSQTAEPAKVMEENFQDAMGQHSHKFIVKYPSDGHEYTIHCGQPQTVLEAIKSHESYKDKIKSPDANIIIKIGEGEKDPIVPTHFPCCYIEEDEHLSVSCHSEMIEKAQSQQHRIFQKDQYTVFYIDTVGGRNAKTKKIFQSKAVKQYDRLCVYGEKGMTFAEVLRRDGRFSDELVDFNLSDINKPKCLTHCTQKVKDSPKPNTFRIRLKKGRSVGNQQENASNSAHGKYGEASVLRIKKKKTVDPYIADVAQQHGTSVGEAKKRGKICDTTDIEKVSEQFPYLGKSMMSTFVSERDWEELELRKENFGKVQQSFSEVHRIRMLLELGKSVCKVVVVGVCEGTGFLLFDRFILTNAHLFKVQQNVLEDGIEAYVLFNYEDPKPNFYCFNAEKSLVDFDRNLDYAILELNLEELTNLMAPLGLLEKFGPVPENGEACIIGHPAGRVKEMDATFIIKKENRQQSTDNHVAPHKDNLFMVLSIKQTLKNQGIDDMMIGQKAENVITYNTFMYHGASGSPVFDGLGRVVGLHTAGFMYGFQNHKEHVIEYAIPLLAIFESFVGNLKRNRNNELLKRVREVAKANQWLKPLLGAEPADAEEAMDVN